MLPIRATAHCQLIYIKTGFNAGRTLLSPSYVHGLVKILSSLEARFQIIRVVVLIPVGGDFIATANPNVAPQALGVVQEILQPLGAARPPDQAAVQPDAHHLRGTPPPLLREVIQAVLEVTVKFPCVGKSVGAGESHVVLAQRVRHDKVGPVPVLPRPVREVVRVGVRIVQESALLHHELSGVDVGLPLVHAHGADAHQVLMYPHRPTDVFPLHVLLHVLVVPPSVPVRRHLPSRLDHGRGGGGVAFERHAHGEDRAGYALSDQ
mmetsp:Transcript_35738/g.76338  ORF Transcript_35738/g.76338 Transcript_35738/m.76338 type:complete len:264 (-) Transcript_35738:397-1188(-)